MFLISDPIRVANPLPRATVKANIVEAVADYGATLHQVQSDEHVIVEYRSPFSARSALLKVPKSAIDAYARGDLDSTAFRKKAVWETQYGSDILSVGGRVLRAHQPLTRLHIPLYCRHARRNTPLYRRDYIAGTQKTVPVIFYK